MNLSIFLQFLTLIWYISAKKYTCVFDELYKDYKPHQNKASHSDQPLLMNVHGRQLATLSRTPIRITLDTSYFDTIINGQNGAAKTTTAHLQFIKRAMQVTQAFYEARLQVTQVVQIYAPDECFDFEPPESHRVDGISFSDLHIYVRYVTDKGQSYGATGVSCKTFDGTNLPDSTFQRGRPTVGRIIFNTYSLLEDEGITNDQALLTNRRFSAITATALHETMHILGFDSSLYSTYLDPRSSTGTVYSSLISAAAKLHPQRPESHLMTSPNLLAWAKDFFDCDNITGMQLQNEDGGIIGSHWQRVIMYDQLMTGTQMGAQKLISGATFALLKDMGWYDVDATFNDTTNYGYKKGCSFYTDACYPSKVLDKYFCDPTTQAEISYCSTANLGKATCTNQTGIMADGCAVWLEYLHCVDPDQPDDGLPEYTFEVYGTNSFCVVGTLGTSSLSQISQDRCYPYVCSYTTGSESVIFTVGSYNITCLKTQKGFKKTLGAFAGYLQCPDHVDFCVNSRKICKNWCSQKGFCMRGICNCLPGYSGEDCSKTICTDTQYYDALSNTCGASCPSGYYQNIYSKTCMKCSSNCQQCVQEPHICSSCHSTVDNPQVFYDGDCYGTCPSGTYQDSDECFDCNTASPYLCKTCQGSATGCTSCQTNYFLQNPTQGACNLDCPDNTYRLKDLVNFKCVKDCNENLVLDGDTCIMCPDGQFKWIDDGDCHSTCLSGYYKDSTQRLCKQCNASCQYCDGPHPQNCTKCWSNKTQKYLLLKMCVSKCPSGYYTNDTAGACQVCTFTLNCATCYYDQTQLKVRCRTCKYGYYFQENKTCLTGCDQYKYKNKWNHSCDNCSSQCGDCISPYESSCTNCRTGKYFLSNQTGGYCLDQCPTQNYVENGVNCLACHKTCKTCNGVSSSQCHSCVTGLFFYQGYCRYVCPEKTYPNTENYQCTDCDTDCKFCFGSTVDNCTSCIDGLVLNNNTCTGSCPSGMIVNQWNVCEKFAFNLMYNAFFAIFCLIYALLTN